MICLNMIFRVGILICTKWRNHCESCRLMFSVSKHQCTLAKEQHVFYIQKKVFNTWMSNNTWKQYSRNINCLCSSCICFIFKIMFSLCKMSKRYIFIHFSCILKCKKCICLVCEKHMLCWRTRVTLFEQCIFYTRKTYILWGHIKTHVLYLFLLLQCMHIVFSPVPIAEGYLLFKSFLIEYMCESRFLLILGIEACNYYLYCNSISLWSTIVQSSINIFIISIIKMDL